MSFIIRPIESHDIEGFYSALCSIACEKKYLLTVNPPPYKNIEKFVHNNLQNNHAQYIAIIDNEIAGWADIIPLTSYSMEHVGSLGMGVLEKYRGFGIGSHLLRTTIEHAWNRGLKRLELGVFSDNEVAINLYKKHGYQVEGIKKYARYLDGKYQDIVMMAQYRP